MGATSTTITHPFESGNRIDGDRPLSKDTGPLFTLLTRQKTPTFRLKIGMGVRLGVTVQRLFGRGLAQLGWRRVVRQVGVGILGLILMALMGCRAAPVGDDVIHLTLWHGVNPPPNRDVLQALVQRFNDTHTDIQVEALYVGQAEQQIPKILAAVVGNVPPDLLWYSPLLTGRLVELGAIRALDDWWATAPIAEDIDPALKQSMTWENHLWSVPFGTNNVGLFYRPSLFEQAGVEIPKTWDELHQVARTLTTGNRHGLLLPLGNGEWTVFMWLPFLWSSGGDVFGPEGVSLSSPEAIAALDYWQDLVRDGSAVLSAPERGFELDKFLAGTVAMQLTGPWTLAQLNATGVDFSVMPIPQNRQPATSTGGENLFVFKSTPEREQAALTVAEFLISESAQTEWAIKTGYLPVNLRSRQSTAYQHYVAENPAVRVFLDQIKVGRSRPLLPGYSRLSESLGRAIEAALLQTATPEEALTKAQQRFKNSQP